MKSPQTRKEGNKGDTTERISCGVSARFQQVGNPQEFLTCEQTLKTVNGLSFPGRIKWMRAWLHAFYEIWAKWEDGDVDSSIPFAWHGCRGKPREDGRVSLVPPICREPRSVSERSGVKKCWKGVMGSKSWGLSSMTYISLSLGPDRTTITG